MLVQFNAVVVLDTVILEQGNNLEKISRRMIWNRIDNIHQKFKIKCCTSYPLIQLNKCQTHARQRGQHHRRLRERRLQQDLTHIPERELEQIVESRLSLFQKAYRLPPPPNLLRHDLGPRNIMCPECRAFHWKSEMLRFSTLRIPRFEMCCSSGDEI